MLDTSKKTNLYLVIVSFFCATATQGQPSLYRSRANLFENIRDEADKIQAAINDRQRIYRSIHPIQALYTLLLKPEFVKPENLDLFFDPKVKLAHSVETKQILEEEINLKRKIIKILHLINSNLSDSSFISDFTKRYENREIPEDRIPIFNYVFLPEIIRGYLNIYKKNDEKAKEAKKIYLKDLAKAILSNKYQKNDKAIRKAERIAGVNGTSSVSRNSLTDRIPPEIAKTIAEFASDSVLDEITNKLKNSENDKLERISGENFKIWEDAVKEAVLEKESI